MPLENEFDPVRAEQAYPLPDGVSDLT